VFVTVSVPASKMPGAALLLRKTELTQVWLVLFGEHAAAALSALVANAASPSSIAADNCSTTVL